MRLSRDLSFGGPVSEGFDADEWNIGARSVRDDLAEVLRDLFLGCEQDGLEKVFRVDLHIWRDEGNGPDDAEGNELARHRAVNLRGIPDWDAMHDQWVISGQPVIGAILPELRRVLAVYDGQNATVWLTIGAAIDQSNGFDDLPEYELQADRGTFTVDPPKRSRVRRPRLAGATV